MNPDYERYTEAERAILRKADLTTEKGRKKVCAKIGHDIMIADPPDWWMVCKRCGKGWGLPGD